MGDTSQHFQNTILVVEDDEGILDVLQMQLEYIGYKVACAGNGKLAFEYLSTNEVPGLILLDLMMPVMNGWQFMDQLMNSEKWKNIPVIIISADQSKVVPEGVAARLEKPIEMQDLFSIVKKHYRN